ncbi:MAG: helix-turn-helix transcriptional regulator [Oscillospiraceae bacterium]|nr:helix-turn-helix transcriptional regulator [Oscillospiraceae bacterium]
MKFAEKLRALRVQKGITQQECADAIGVTSRTYLSYENDGRYPRKRTVYQKLAELFGVDTNYLLTEDEEFVAEAAEQYGSRGRRQAEALLAEMTGLFAGGELTDSDRDAIMIAMQRVYFECKEKNRKYAPKKRRKDEE